MVRSGRLIRQFWRYLTIGTFALTVCAASAANAFAAAQSFGAIAVGNAAHVPEPASWALFATGIGAIGWLVRRRRQA
jgi:hypothetical protein